MHYVSYLDVKCYDHKIISVFWFLIYQLKNSSFPSVFSDAIPLFLTSDLHFSVIVIKNY